MMVITGMKTGGAERVMATLCNELVKSNEIILVILKDKESDYYISDNVKVIAGDIKSKNMIDSVTFLKKQIEFNKPDIIVSFMTKTNIVLMATKKIMKCKIPCVIAERANPFFTKGILNFLRKRLYTYADGCVFQTKQQQDYYKKIIKCESIIIRNPLNPDFKPQIHDGEYEKRIVCTGRLYKEKNQQLLIKAFSKIEKKYPEYKLELYGDGPTKRELQETINNLQLQDKVFLMGRKDNIQNYINSAEIFVLPSNSEGMPNALMEAMALGLACIATDCPIGGSAILIKDGENGLLVPMNDVDEMEKGIEKLIENKDFASKLREEAKKVIQEYDVKNICKEWEMYLRKVYNN